jgi:N-acetylmuramoyl-L-alanine amidase
VHVNASRKRSAKGIETYFLNWTNDREAIKVAARENKISIKKMKKMQDSTQFILQDLARKNKNEESMRFAHSVQNSMVSTLKKNYSRIDNLGVKYALFYVLIGAEMPSILVETSFISNRVEEKRLSTEAYKDRLAEAIANGINSYITKSTLIVNSDPKKMTGG